jgi:hypothetical protein
MCRIDQQLICGPGSGHHQGEDYTSANPSTRAQGKVLDDHQGDRGSSEGLGGSG